MAGFDYRPITDVWTCARPKVPYYGAYPSGFLWRARALLGASLQDCVIHVCSGAARLYSHPDYGVTKGVPQEGFGASDVTLDVASELTIGPWTVQPDYVHDVRAPLPYEGAVFQLADPPYTPEDAAHYAEGAAAFPEPRKLLANCLDAAALYGRVGFLHYMAPRPPKGVKFLACAAVFDGFDNRIRCFSVYEKR